MSQPVRNSEQSRRPWGWRSMAAWRIASLTLILSLLGMAAQAASPLRITEINYYPPSSENQYEYVELQNTSTATISLVGMKLADAVTFTFPSGTSLAAGAYICVVANQTSFVARYGTTPKVAGVFSGKLSNEGELITLLDSTGTVVETFTYGVDGKWPSRACGGGSSLEIKDATSDPTDPDNWHSSNNVLGSPGAAGSVNAADIVINEVLPHTDPPQEDAIELYNKTSAPVDIGGWFLSDDLYSSTNGTINLGKFQIPAGTVIAANGYKVFYANDFSTNNTRTPFLLSMAGDRLYLTAPNTTGNPGIFVDQVDFEASYNGDAYGRYKTTDGTDFVILNYPTLGVTDYTTAEQFRQGTGAANTSPRIGKVVINEVMYHPPDLTGGINDIADEYIELYNRSNDAVNLYNSNFNLSWTISGGVDYSFEQGQYIAPKSYLLVVPFDPVTSPTQAAAFRANYPNLDPAVPLAGPWSGNLANSSESIRLSSPDEPPDSGEIPMVPLDRVKYEDSSPWPAAADGNGPSLERISPDIYGNEPTNWVALTAKGTPTRMNTTQNSIRPAAWTIFQ